MEGFLGIGGNELLIILIFAFLIFGPDKLPSIARTIGRAIAKFREAQDEVNEVIRREVYDPDADNQEEQVEKAARKVASVTQPAPAKTESFAERKARYDKIRAERKAKEEAAAAAAAAKSAGSPGVQAVATAPEPTTEDLDALLGVSKAAPGVAAQVATQAPAPYAAGASAQDSPYAAPTQGGDA